MKTELLKKAALAVNDAYSKPMAQEYRNIHNSELQALCNPKDILEFIDKFEEVQSSLAFYKRRVDLLQECQPMMRDPERTIACDIIANGSLLEPGFSGNRYELSDEVKETRLAALTDVAAMIGANATYEELVEYVSEEISAIQNKTQAHQRDR